MYFISGKVVALAAFSGLVPLWELRISRTSEFDRLVEVFGPPNPVIELFGRVLFCQLLGSSSKSWVKVNHPGVRFCSVIDFYEAETRNKGHD